MKDFDKRVVVAHFLEVTSPVTPDAAKLFLCITLYIVAKLYQFLATLLQLSFGRNVYLFCLVRL